MKKLISCLTAAALCAASLAAFPVSAGETDDLWERFLRYDLCITDFDALTAEQQELCHFIYDTEQNSNDTIRCERARRVLAGDDVGERVSLDELEGAYGIWDNYSTVTKYGWQQYIHCVPDIVYLNDTFNSLPVVDGQAATNEYWLDDEGKEFVVFYDKYHASSPESIRHFEVFNENKESVKSIPCAMPDEVYNDLVIDEECAKALGYTVKNGGFYYTRPDGTAVLAGSIYTQSKTLEPISEPFVIESEINGCPVTAIDGGALISSMFETIELPDTIETIDMFAFADCPYLKSINLPESLQYVSHYAFYNCDDITEMDIDCPELKLCWQSFIFNDGIESASLDVKEIGQDVFGGTDSLKEVRIGDNVSKIGYKAFYGCKELSNVVISNGVNTIGQGAFAGTKVKSVFIPSSVTVIGSIEWDLGALASAGSASEWTPHPLTDEAICAFDSDCVISGNVGSEADRYAEEWGLEFVPVGAVSGDVNGDSSVNMADAVSIMRNTADPDDFPLTVRQKQYADVIGSDGVTNLDALTIQQFEAGIVTQLPVADT